MNFKENRFVKSVAASVAVMGLVCSTHAAAPAKAGKISTRTLSYIKRVVAALSCAALAASALPASEAMAADNNAGQNPLYAAENDSRKIITGFSGGPEDFNILKKEDLSDVLSFLPESGTAVLDGGQEETIPLSWECMDDYENTEYESYTFEASWDTGRYALDKRLSEQDIPRAEVSIIRENRNILLAEKGILPAVNSVLTSRDISGVCRVVLKEHNLGGRSEFWVTIDGATHVGFCMHPGRPAPLDGTYEYFGADLGGGRYQITVRSDYVTSDLGQIHPADRGLIKGNPPYQTQGIGDFVIEINGNLNLKKTSANESITGGNSYYSLNGAEFGVYRNGECTDLAGVLVTNGNGDSNTVSLSPGTYWVKETKAPKGYAVSSEVKMVNVAAGSTNTVSFSDVPLGSLSLKKASARPEITNGNACYSLKGAEFAVYSDSACTAKAATLTTNADGTTGKATLNAGDYWIKETKAPKGYALESKPKKVTVKGDTVVTFADIPQNNPVNIILGKVDKETNRNKPSGSASLEGAEFTVKYYDVEMDKDPAQEGKKAVRTWEFKTNSDGFINFSESYKVRGDEFYYASNGKITLPIGTITIQETKAPEGYELNNEVFVRRVMADGNGLETVETYSRPVIQEQVIRGDIQLIKHARGLNEDRDEIQAPLEGVEFTITNKKTGESCVLTTDKRGFATTESLGNKLGGLPYGTYEVKETKTPEGLKTVEPFEITIDDENRLYYYIVEDKPIKAPVMVQKKDASTGKLIMSDASEFQVLDKSGKPVSMVVTRYPELVETDTFVTSKGVFILPEQLPAGTYTLKETKAPEGYVLADPIEFTVTSGQNWDNPIVVECFDENVMGHISIEKTDFHTGGALEGAVFTITADEDIVTGDGTVRAERGDVVDTITTGDDGKASSKELFLGKYRVEEIQAPQHYALDKENSFTAELEYEGQDVSVVYASGSAKNRETEVILKKVKTGTETPVEGAVFRVWEKDDEDTAVEFKTGPDGLIEIKELKHGTVYCIQETATAPGCIVDDKITEISVDENGLIDDSQTHFFTVENDYTQLIKTTASDPAAGTGTGLSRKEMTIVDTVEFKNLEPGREYTVKGVLMDKSTGKPLLAGGAEVTAETVFTAESKDGTVDVVFTFDGSDMKGKTVVVFEEAYTDGVKICVHADIEDKGQTVHIVEKPKEPVEETPPVVEKITKPVKTGDQNAGAVVIFSLLLSCTCIVICARIRDKR